MIGGGDWAEDRIIADCFKSWIAGKPVKIRNPYSTRPWQHVLEPLSGYILAGSLLLKNKKKYQVIPLILDPTDLTIKKF